MKRSEVVKLIHEVISTELRTTEEFSLLDCDDLLNKLEKAGMLPPPLKTDAVTSSIVYCYYPEVEEIEKDGTLDIAKSKLWEDE